MSRIMAIEDEVRNFQKPFLVAGVAGLVACVIGLALSPQQFLRSYLFAYLFWLGVGLGCLPVLMLYHLVGGAWGVGSALLAAAIDWARESGLHKLNLGVFPHNTAAIALYRKFGFVEEGRQVKQYRRSSGELWDSIEMGLLL